MKVSVAISNRHVHFTKEIYEELFGDAPFESKRALNQVGEYASIYTVDLEYNGKKIEHVRVVGPLRKYNQVELLGSDLEYLGIDAPARKSGKVDNTPGIKVINGDKSVILESGVIRAERHIHMNQELASKLGFKDEDKVIVHAGDKDFDANIKVSDNGYYEMHIDKDEALEYNLETGDEVEYEKMED